MFNTACQLEQQSLEATEYELPYHQATMLLLEAKK
jgi:hypothetical protein